MADRYINFCNETHCMCHPHKDNVDWREFAACAGMDPNMFFPNERGYKESDERAAKSVCYLCPVQEECLAYALRHYESDGVWGGTTEDERKRLRRAGIVGERVPANLADVVQLSSKVRGRG